MLPIRICFFMLALAAAQAGAQPPAADSHEAGTLLPFGAPLDDAALGDLRGGTDTTVNDMRLSGTTAANTAIDVMTGTNTIGTGAFSAMSGIPIVIQNTGANVLIQNAVILNLQVQ
jgi:hypothetical protein